MKKFDASFLTFLLLLLSGEIKKEKVKFTLRQAMKAQMESRSIALLVL
jgi:hypothetical protein